MDGTGIEPVAFSTSKKRSTTELTVHVAVFCYQFSTKNNLVQTYSINYRSFISLSISIKASIRFFLISSE